MKTLKQIFQLESIPCVYLHDILKRLPAKLCLDVSFRCLSSFVAFCVTLPVMMLLTVMHTFLGNGPKLTDWSK